MRRSHRSVPFVARIGAALLAPQVAGCSEGAPVLSFFGAYFPDWLACAILGMAAAGAARAVMTVSGLSRQLPHQFLLCVAIGTMAAILAALVVFGR